LFLKRLGQVKAQRYQWPCTFYNKAPYIKSLLKIGFSVKQMKVSTNWFIVPVINCILKDTHQKAPKAT
jgi:hypothetical protein